MNEQEKEKAVEVGADIANYAIDKLDGHSLSFCIELISALVSTIIKTLHENSGHENDTSFFTYMEIKFLLHFKEAMDLLKEQDNE